jgi:hypothetical protein
MTDDNLATYLNDHLAGAVMALELLDQLVTAHSRSELGDFFHQLHSDIAADRDELRGLMERLEISESGTRKASAWLAEKITQLKLKFDDPKGGSFRLFESLEALSLGIEGKRSLWITLMTVSAKSTSLEILDYERLRDRAQEQRDRVDKLRLEIAGKALFE